MDGTAVFAGDYIAAAGGRYFLSAELGDLTVRALAELFCLGMHAFCPQR